jgi:hypothetical protein
VTASEEGVEKLIGDDALIHESRLNSVPKRESSLSQGGDLFLGGLFHW